MRRRLPAVVAAALLVAATGAVGAEAPVREIDPSALLAEATALGIPVTITADALSYDETTGTAEAEGNVEVAFGSRTLRADRIRYDSRSQEAEFVSNVRYWDAGDEFSFEKIRLNFATERGVLENGRIRLSTNNYQIASERIEKTGKRSFFVRRGTLTTCPCCDPPPDWSFEVGESRVTIDGYAVGKNVTMRVRGVPVLWLPYAAFPVKLTRQSGLLLPGFSSSPSRGFTFSVPVYWAINRWSDATITVESMTKRGIRPEAEYRYVLNPRSEGEIRGTAYHDRIRGETRSRVYGRNVFRYGEEVTANAKVDLASDERYYVDLVDEDILRTGRHVPSRGFVGKSGQSSGNALSVVWVEDVQGVPADNVIQRLPEYSGTVLPRSIGTTGIYGSGEAQAVYFYRRAGERAVRGRVFAELARPLGLYPSVSLTPFLFADLLESRIASGPAAGDDSGRVVPGAGAVLKADLRRDFPGKGEGRLVHAVSTSAAFRWAPQVGQEDIPVVDQRDRIEERKQWTFVMDQRLLRTHPDSGPAEIASLEIDWAVETGSIRRSGSPYVDPLSPYARALRDEVDLAVGHRGAGRTESDLLARLRVTPGARWNLGGESLLDLAEGRIVTAAVSGEWVRDKDNRAGAEYRLTKTLAEDVAGRFSLRPVRLLKLAGEAHYSIRNKGLTDGSATVTLYPASECWSVGVVVGRRSLPSETSFKVTFSLRGIGSVGD